MVECIMTVVTFNMFITVVYFILDKKKYKTTTTTIEKLQQRIYDHNENNNFSHCFRQHETYELDPPAVSVTLCLDNSNSYDR